ncbi:MAG: cob(I)yrinic acid a,c-diamide adenosyltransferase [Candidatus Micrarchaeota archaeon]
MKSYTGKGDGGQTTLGNGECRPKSDAVFYAIGSLDELSSAIGIAKAQAGDDDELGRIQADLFGAGALISNAALAQKAPGFGEKLKRLEGWIDKMDEKLPELGHFILPGGSEIAARLHLARAVCRRAERRVQTLGRDDLAPVLAYLNRLSSYFFARARFENMKAGVKEKEWKGE